MREREGGERLYFVHVTSTIRYRQNNGKLERAVQTINISTDSYLALLAYRATALDCGYSTAELLMVDSHVPYSHPNVSVNATTSKAGTE